MGDRFDQSKAAAITKSLSTANNDPDNAHPTGLNGHIVTPLDDLLMEVPLLSNANDGLSNGASVQDALATPALFSMPLDARELLLRLEEFGIKPPPGDPGSKTWTKKARGIFTQHVRQSGGVIISADTPREKSERTIATTVFNGHTPDNATSSTTIEDPIVIDYEIQLGNRAVRTDIKSSDGPFQYFPESTTYYPETVTEALGALFKEYNHAFGQLVTANREWETDYQYCMAGQDGTPVNYFVQIDMVGLSDDYLEAAANRDVNQVREELRRRIFEIENSLAGYGLLSGIFARDEQASFFGTRFRASLDVLRQTHNRPIALLAVTDEKYEAMRRSEFGKEPGEPLTDEEVRRISGFDRLYGPTEFLQYLEMQGGNCDQLLYARTSDPLVKLQNPETQVATPLLENAATREIIKANAVTFNVDNPRWEQGDPRRINDTKAYLQAMGMAYVAYSLDDLRSPEFAAHLVSQGIDPTTVESQTTFLRAKPMQAYGGYGHVRGRLRDRDFRHKLDKDGLRKRGPYVVQPEMQIPTVKNLADGQVVTHIDRNFFSFTSGQPQFLGGFRSFMPVESREAKNGRNHGSHDTVWAEIQG